MNCISTLKIGATIILLGMLGACKSDTGAPSNNLPLTRSNADDSTSTTSSVSTTIPASGGVAPQQTVAGAPYNYCTTGNGAGSWCNYKCGSTGLWCSYDAPNKQQPCVIPVGVTGTTCANNGATDNPPATTATTTTAQPASSGTTIVFNSNPTNTPAGACPSCNNCGSRCCHNPGTWYACNGWWCAKDNNGLGAECLVQQMDTATANAYIAAATAAAVAAGTSSGSCPDCNNCGSKCCHNPGAWYACNGWWCANDNNGSGAACVVRQMDGSTGSSSGSSSSGKYCDSSGTCYPYCTNGSNTGNSFGWQPELGGPNGGSCRASSASY